MAAHSYQNIHLIESIRPDIVALFGADPIRRMDIRQMIELHIDNKAQASVATRPVELAQLVQVASFAEASQRMKVPA